MAFNPWRIKSWVYLGSVLHALSTHFDVPEGGSEEDQCFTRITPQEMEDGTTSLPFLAMVNIGLNEAAVRCAMVCLALVHFQWSPSEKRMLLASPYFSSLSPQETRGIDPSCYSGNAPLRSGLSKLLYFSSLWQLQPCEVSRVHTVNVQHTRYFPQLLSFMNLHWSHDYPDTDFLLKYHEESCEIMLVWGSTLVSV